MDNIFAQSKRILVVWTDNHEPENLEEFKDIIETKAKRAYIVIENIQALLQSRLASSSFDIILYDLVNKQDTSTNIDYLNEFFRLLRPNSYIIMHVKHQLQKQFLNYFKICGFDNCNPLDANSSFLIVNKDEIVKRFGSLWLCQKPAFDIGYSVPISKTGVKLIRQISTTGGGRKMWTIEDDDEEDNIEDDDNAEQRSTNQDCDSKKLSANFRKTWQNRTFDVETTSEKPLKNSYGSFDLENTHRSATYPIHGSSSLNSNESSAFLRMSDV